MTRPLDEIPVEVSLYQKSDKIYPREVQGRFASLRSISVWGLLAVYYITPWLTWNNRQAVLFDLPDRQFYVFGITFWPQDFFFLALMLVVAGLSLFFFTAIAGRVWCGYACPQTVWTEAFIRMERWVEGSRAKQIKLSKQAWNAEKLRKRFSKQFLWISFSLFTGFTFVGYFQPITVLASDIASFDVAGWPLFWTLFYALATYGNAGFLREQVCKYMCPYARFQSAMFDKDTLIVAYDSSRGEPRTRGKKRTTELIDGGDCVDCGICVQVCPTGIDIREGLQYECIACAACIDACDTVMEKVGCDKGLIRYGSLATERGANISLYQTLFRPRVLIYGFILLSLITGLITALVLRPEFQTDILRERNSLYSFTQDGRIQNTYTLRLINKSQRDSTYYISIKGLTEAEIQVVKGGSALGAKTLRSNAIAPGEIGDLVVSINVLPSTLNKMVTPFTFEVSDSVELTTTIVEESKYWAPKQ